MNEEEDSECTERAWAQSCSLQPRSNVVSCCEQDHGRETTDSLGSDQRCPIRDGLGDGIVDLQTVTTCLQPWSCEYLDLGRLTADPTRPPNNGPATIAVMMAMAGKMQSLTSELSCG